MFTAVVLLIAFLLPLAWAESSCNHESSPGLSMCYGCPPRYSDGKLCASTTRYNDLTKGACGCGTEPNPVSYWTKSRFTAALNAINLDESNPDLGWCPSGCGMCFRLCSTGGTTSGKSTAAGVCREFIVENRCGDGYHQPGQAQWCRQEMSYSACSSNPSACSNFKATNDYGYPAHFDLQDAAYQVSNLGWDNVEVTFERIDCNSNEFPFGQSCQCAWGKNFNATA